MEILSSGSFVILENREKIEQLIFTANELAKAASQAEGFISTTGGISGSLLGCGRAQNAGAAPTRKRQSRTFF